MTDDEVQESHTWFPIRQLAPVLLTKIPAQAAVKKVFENAFRSPSIPNGETR
jgi:hypothetical protein